ncbi:MAG: pnpB [Verrucomicrobiaceae bacterium]|nr:pnpB [Verrucomicrobiaceae bacterium]
MKNIAIIYFTGTGSTGKLAEAVHAGAASVADMQAELIAIEGKDIVDGRYSNDAVFEKLNKADAIIFGTPTIMGGPSAQFKAFADATGGIWFGQGWKDKLAGGFSMSGSPSGDKLNTLQYLHLLASQHGMLWVSTGGMPSFYAGKTDGYNRLGSYLGVMGQNTTPQGQPAAIDSGDALTGQEYGKRVAELALKLRES